MNIIAIVTMALASASSTDGVAALDGLAAELKTARSSESVTLTRCPGSMDAFAGLAQDVIIAKLGTPDLNESGTAADGKEISVHQYLFSPSDAAWIGVTVSAGGWTAVKPLGEPFTVVQFHYDSAGVLLSALCYDRA